MEEKDASPPSTFICPFQQSGPKQPIRLYTSPEEKRSSLALTTQSGLSTPVPAGVSQGWLPCAFSCRTLPPQRYREG